LPPRVGSRAVAPHLAGDGREVPFNLEEVGAAIDEVAQPLRASHAPSTVRRVERCTKRW
jgi:hypothetical protein